MVVQHNMQAMNANRMLNVTTNAQSKSSEKLSSGYRINRAADDAAGLSISEKMRKQIRGLDQASTNAEDGVSAVQTAEGALTEVHDMLQRMNALAVQAANGTNSESDRQSIQDEIDQLTTEIDRVAETTKFNETYLLKGNTSGTSSKVNVAAHDAGLDGKLVDSGNGTTTFTLNDALEVGDTVTIGGSEYNIVASADPEDYESIESLTGGEEDTIVQDGVTYTYVAAGGTATGGQTVTTAGWYANDDTTTTSSDLTDNTWIKEGATYNGTTTLYGSSSLEVDGGATTVEDMQEAIKALDDGTTVTVYNADGNATATYIIGTSTDEDNNVYTADKLASMITSGMYINDETSTYYTVSSESDDENDITVQEAYDLMADELAKASSIGTDSGSEATVVNNGDGSFTINQGTVEVKDSLSFSLHVGADADMTNKIIVDIDSMSAAGLGVKGLTVAGDDVTNATYAIDAISDAIAKVSEQRSALGAVQNRLEHTISNLDNVVENTTSAESRIRDTDMAEEMVEYSKNNILAQAGQSMLAQANTATQGVLSLLG